METVSIEYAYQMLDRITSGSTEGKPFEIPDNEASAVFVDILDRLCRECSLNSRHSINSYLSLRIRHGTISGQLRQPSQEQHLLTIVSIDGEYSPNLHWYELLMSKLGETGASFVSYQLSSFSKEYDALIERFSSDYVQVRRQDKPKRLITYRFADPVIIGYASDASSFTDFDQFLEEFFPIY